MKLDMNICKIYDVYVAIHAHVSYLALTILCISVYSTNLLGCIVSSFLFFPRQTSDVSIVMVIDLSSTKKGLRLILYNSLA